MKFAFSFAFLLLISLTGYSQQYHPFPTDSAVWENFTIYDDNMTVDYPRYAINGDDTTYNGKRYLKLLGSINSQGYRGLIREDSLKRIFFIPRDSTQEFLLYDFSLSIGDTAWLWRSEYQEPAGLYKFQITGEDSILLNNGSYRRVLKVNNWTKWIEGIGGTGGLLFDGRMDLKIVKLTCFHQKGQTLICPGVGIEEREQFQANLSISPNPFISGTTIHIDDTRYDALQLRLYDISGKLVQQHNVAGNTYVLQREALESGIYFLEFANEQEVLAVKKLVVQ